MVLGSARKVLLSALLLTFTAQGQSLTGSVTGVVADRSGSAIPAAIVKLVSDATESVRIVTTTEEGTFVFNAIASGVYTIEVEHPGFKSYRRTGIELTPNESFSSGTIRLDIGDVTESVTVREQGATVQTASGERSGIITAEQMQDLTIINRDFQMLVALLPGVVDTPGNETQGFGGSGTFNVLGGRASGNNISIDGVPSDNSNSTSINTYISMDSVSAVKIQVSNFQAEFGRKPGAAIQAVSKGGTHQYHGAAYWYKRHEQFNANTFFNNRNGVPEPRYRYTTAGFNIGGPLPLPWIGRKKLFFFVSTEQWREARPQDIRQVTVPTAAERNGDFSNSRDLNNALIIVKDPLNGQKAFPGNIVPQDRINRMGQKYLELLPLPNYFNQAIAAGRYNYQVQESLNIPKHTEMMRVDYNVGPKTNVYGRLNYWWEDIQGWAVPAGNSNWGWLPSRYEDISRTATIAMTHFLGPATILEASVAGSEWTERGGPLDQNRLDALDRTKSGIDIPQLDPSGNPYHLVPEATFGGVNAAANPAYEGRFPIHGTETILTATATITRTHGTHISKIGMMFEHWWEAKGPNANFAGKIDFSRNSTNPNDSNHPYANALLGNFYSYTESTLRPELIGRITGMEWYAQDNWRVRPNLTLDLGVRFGRSDPFHSSRRDEAGFVPSRYNVARAVQLIQPVMVNGKRMGLNPVTAEILPAISIGAVAPGSGDPFNGTVNLLTDSAYPAGLRYGSGVKTAPRFGFAYDPFRKGKTAIRGGFGTFYEIHERDNLTYGFFGNPPLKQDPILYYGNLQKFLADPGLIFPSNTTGIDPARPLGRTMNFSLGVQQMVGFGTLVDIAYVGALSRHLVERRNINSIPFGTDFQPWAKDATTNRPLSAQFLRPYLGYGDILYYSYDGNSNYNSLQVSVNRRFSKRIEYGVSWTWSKAMDYADNESTTISSLINPRVWNYGKAGFDRTHILKMYWMWDVPKASSLWNTAFSRKVLDGWQLTGITTFMSGAPNGIGLSFTTGTDITGSPSDGPRVVVIQNPILPKEERTFSRNFNTEAFAPPTVGTFGNAPKDVFRGPGFANWDISSFKNFKLPWERTKMQFRGEFYNAFNHTEFSALDTGARFDPQGNQTNARFGEFTNSKPARRIQLALRLTF